MAADLWNETRSWISRSQEGDREAFGHIVRRYEGRIQAWIRPQIGEHLQHLVEVEDVTQDIFMRAFQLIDRFEWRNEPAFWGWLSGIARNVIRQAVRRRRTRGRDVRREVGWEAENDITSGLAVAGVSPSKVMRRNERFERLKRALDTLSADHRRAIFLAYVRRLPTSEIADRLGRSPNATSMLLLRAYRQLRRCFGHTESLGLQDSDNLEEAFGTDGT